MKAKQKELGQIKIGPVEIAPPEMKVRLHWNILPDVTIDLKAKPGVGFASILRPRATVLIGDKAYKLDPWDPRKVYEADPKIFAERTLFDSLMQIGIIPTIIMIAAIGYGVYKLVPKILPKLIPEKTITPK